MRTLSLLGVATLVACSTPATAPTDTPVASSSTHPVVTSPGDSTRPAVDTVTLVGVLVGGGNWQTMEQGPTVDVFWGDKVPVDTPYVVRSHYYFRANNAAGDSVGWAAVASVDSVPFLSGCPVPGAPVCTEVPANACPPALILQCPVTAALPPGGGGDYLVWVTPQAISGAVVRNPGTEMAFLLVVYELGCTPALCGVSASASGQARMISIPRATSSGSSNWM